MCGACIGQVQKNSCKKTGQTEVTFTENVGGKMGYVWHCFGRGLYFLLVKYILKINY
jgi:hypothetical protein